MAKIEYINGVRYIDGYLCNDAGQPITMNNGYSSEEEKEASTSYLMAKWYEKPKKVVEDKPKKPHKKRAKFNYAPPLEDERWH